MKPPATSRRRLLGALAASLASAFAGCDAGARRSDGRAEASLWFSYGGKNREVLLELVRRFEASQPHYALHAVYQGDYFEGLAKLRTAIAARAAPALTHVVAEVVPYLAEAGVLEDLARFGLSDAGVVPALAQGGTFTQIGATRPLVALPFNRSTPIAYYNRRVFAEAGLAPPRTWDELRAVARALTRDDARGGRRHGFACPVDWWFWAALVGQAGGELIEPDGAISLGGEAGVRALSLWKELVAAGHMKPPPGRDYNAWQATNSDFLSGRVPLIWTSTAFLRYLEENAAFEVGAAALPRDARAAVPTGGTFFVMPRGSAAPAQEAAAAFLRFMMEPANSNAWATRTGYIPVTREGLRLLEDAGHYRAHPNDRVALDQLADAQPWPWSTELFRVQREAVQPRLEGAVLGHEDARAALDEARRAAREADR